MLPSCIIYTSTLLLPLSAAASTQLGPMRRRQSIYRCLSLHPSKFTLSAIKIFGTKFLDQELISYRYTRLVLLVAFVVLAGTTSSKKPKSPSFQM